MQLPASALLEPLRYLALWPPDRQAEAERLIASLPTAQAATAELVNRAWLTKYQGDELCAGRGYWLLLGPYLLLDRLGAGGMGEVFRARHRVMKREVALKRMRSEMVESPALVQRFLREAEAAAKLSHPNVVHVYDAGDAGGALYLTMELLTGVDLAKHLQRHRTLPVGEAVEYVRQACRGMQHAHEKGLVHRDIKPANLMLTDEKQVKILDMGLALMTDASAMTHTGERFGTWDYMAPEQATNAHQVDIRADTFSLGCTLYHLLTGQAPFAGRPEAPAFRPFLYLSAEPPPIESIRPEVPSALGDVVRRMMAKERTQRHPTPGEAAAALGAVLRHLDGAREVRSEQPPPAASHALIGPEPANPETVIPEGNEAGEPPRRAVVLSELPQEIVNSIGMKFVLVQPGKFLMGSPSGEARRGGDERQHEVTLTRAFYLGVCPVTQGQWKSVMGYNPSCFSRGGGGKDRVKSVSDADLDLFPVECVSWQDVQAFLKELAGLNEESRGRQECRLPTEAEWEYACRGGHLIQELGDGHTLPFHFGLSTSSLSSAQANIDGNEPYGGAAKGPYLGRTCKVGSYRANRLGLFDMHGNVWEWCADWYGEYPARPAVDPLGPSGGTFRVYRGGSWFSSARVCRSAFRLSDSPGYRYYDLGFRVAVVPRE